MIFTSNIFLFLFLPVVLVVYYLLCRKLRNGFLLLASLLFYAWGEPKFVLVMIGSIIFNYAMACFISGCQEKKRGKNREKLLLVITVVVNLSVLFLYKYLDFFITNVNLLGLNLPLRGLVLPIGISFFTFQAMSYVIDVYRRDSAVQKNPLNVGLYISLFPQLVAGPIVRYQTIEKQIVSRRVNFDMFSDGVRRFIIGFSKKILLANSLAVVADRAFNMPDAQRSVLFAWIGIAAYSFQILFDFSGYSDMAIGLGKMFGFQFLENFNYPYISKSISEFWRRWHISLGSWFRDYVYIPLGGSRVATQKRVVFNLFVVWFLTGVWHGASWNFILWGLLYFVLIAWEKVSGYPKKFTKPAYKHLYRVFTLLCVMGGWVLFRAVGLGSAVGYLGSMLGLSGNAPGSADAVWALREYGVIFIFAALCSTPLFAKIGAWAEKTGSRSALALSGAGKILLYGTLFVWGVSYLILGGHNPFIYFNF